MQKATLLLEDGSKWEGTALGVPGAAVGYLSLYAGEDYMDVLTNPSSSGQICAFSIPTVGNWGVNTEHCETGKPWIRGVIARHVCTKPKNWRSAETLDYYLRRNVIIGVSDIDTERLFRYAAKHGIQKCAVVSSPGFTGWPALEQQVLSYGYDNTFPNAVKSAQTYGPVRGVIAHVAVCDFGASYGLVRLLNSMRIRTTLLPPYDAATIVHRGGYDGLILPQGPGSPRNHPGISQAVESIIDAGVPLMGFGLGALFIGAAYGIQIERMHTPHKGAWYPVRHEETGQTVYTRQYHELSLTGPLPPGLKVTHRSPADHTVEGFRALEKPVAARQYLPCSDLRLGGTGEMMSALFTLLKGELPNG